IRRVHLRRLARHFHRLARRSDGERHVRSARRVNQKLNPLLLVPAEALHLHRELISSGKKLEKFVSSNRACGRSTLDATVRTAQRNFRRGHCRAARVRNRSAQGSSRRLCPNDSIRQAENHQQASKQAASTHPGPPRTTAVKCPSTATAP